jgi:hypothetical protein
MARSRLVVVRAVLIGSDGTADESELLELRGCLAEGDRPDGPWRICHRRGGAVVSEASLAHTAEGWTVGGGEDCDAPVRCLGLTMLRPGEYLTLHTDGHGTPSSFRIVNVAPADPGAGRGAPS